MHDGSPVLNQSLEVLREFRRSGVLIACYQKETIRMAGPPHRDYKEFEVLASVGTPKNKNAVRPSGTLKARLAVDRSTGGDGVQKSGIQVIGGWPEVDATVTARSSSRRPSQANAPDAASRVSPLCFHALWKPGWLGSSGRGRM